MMIQIKDFKAISLDALCSSFYVRIFPYQRINIFLQKKKNYREAAKKNMQNVLYNKCDEEVEYYRNKIYVRMIDISKLFKFLTFPFAVPLACWHPRNLSPSFHPSTLWTSWTSIWDTNGKIRSLLERGSQRRNFEN